jgi:RhtB (resistance to homoserine/threonine) family protein
MNSIYLLAGICLIGMVSPGPDFVIVVRNALAYPKRQAVATALGIVSGCCVHATYCTLGLALVITQSVLLFSVIKYTGACYLVYLGVKCLLSKADPRPLLRRVKHETVSVRTAYFEGLWCNLLNPKLAVFLLSLFTQFISVDAGIAQKATVAGVFVGESVVYWPLLALALQGHTVRRAFAKVQLAFDRTCGALLIYLGCRVAFSRD